MEKNQMHKHYAIQISIPIEGTLTLIANTEETTFKTAVFIKPNILHRLESKGNNLHIFFNPHSRIGFYINSLIRDKPYYFNDELITNLVRPAKDFINNVIDIASLAECIEKNFEESSSFKKFESNASERILSVLDYIYKNKHRWVQAEECANLIHLSKSRFLHFFNEETGSTFRRSQLWIRICESVMMLKEKGISETAHHYGFYDNAHYGRAFKENLGFTPKAFINSAVLYNISEN
ncbi:MAG: AraC family transcriptional regulator [Winogradskyella sp.]|nr:MAG: AraC family transcriptional regulator [Winogradskyella sp.]